MTAWKTGYFSGWLCLYILSALADGKLCYMLYQEISQLTGSLSRNHRNGSTSPRKSSVRSSLSKVGLPIVQLRLTMFTALCLFSSTIIEIARFSATIVYSAQNRLDEFEESFLELALMFLTNGSVVTAYLTLFFVFLERLRSTFGSVRSVKTPEWFFRLWYGLSMVAVISGLCSPGLLQFGYPRLAASAVSIGVMIYFIGSFSVMYMFLYSTLKVARSSNYDMCNQSRNGSKSAGNHSREQRIVINTAVSPRSIGSTMENKLELTSKFSLFGTTIDGDSSHNTGKMGNAKGTTENHNEEETGMKHNSCLSPGSPSPSPSPSPPVSPRRAVLSLTDQPSNTERKIISRDDPCGLLNAAVRLTVCATVSLLTTCITMCSLILVLATMSPFTDINFQTVMFNGAFLVDPPLNILAMLFMFKSTEPMYYRVFGPLDRLLFTIITPAINRIDSKIVTMNNRESILTMDSTHGK